MTAWMNRFVVLGVSLAVLLPPAVAEAATDRAQLTWNTSTDLDLHVWDQEGNHAWYGEPNGIPNATLSDDDTVGFGPEFYTDADSPSTRSFYYCVHYYGPGESGDATPTTAATLVLTDPDGGQRTQNFELNNRDWANAGSSPVGVSGNCESGFPPPDDPPPDCTIIGTAGDDNLSGTPGADTICGLEGNDRLLGGGGNDTLVGGDGEDSLFGQDGKDAIDGAGGKDFIRGGPGGDDITAGGEDDIVSGDAGDDSIDGGLGEDTVAHLGSTRSIRANLALGRSSGQGNDSLAGLENLHGSDHPDRLAGSSAGNLVWGRAGNDVVLGEGGDDLVFGGDGTDSLDGGAGRDFLNGGRGNDVGNGGGGQDTCHLVSGGQRNCELPRVPDDARVLPQGTASLARHQVAEAVPGRATADRDYLSMLQVRTHQLCAAGVCARARYGFHDRVYKRHESDDWDDQSEIEFWGTSVATWVGVRHYRTCIYDRWIVRASRPLAQTAVWFYEEGPFQYYPYNYGAFSVLRYEPNLTYWCTAGGTTIRNRYYMQASTIRAEIDYLVHEQWAAIYPTRSSWVKNRPALQKLSKDFIEFDD